jgi:hypothetical protein
MVSAWLMASAWWLAPSVSEWGGRLQWLSWIPDAVWLVATLLPAVVAGVLACRTSSHWRLRVLLAGLPIVGPAGGVLSREYGWTPPIAGPQVRLIFLNAQDPPASPARIAVARLEALSPDLVVVSNPGWMASVWREAHVETSDGEGDAWSVQWRTPVMTASRHGACVLRTRLIADGIRVMLIELPPRLAARIGVDRLMLIDLPSDPDLDRDRIMDRLLGGLQLSALDGLKDVGLVIGDFNMTPRTPALVRGRGSLRDLVSEEGDGWTATWPRLRPILRIDQIFGAVTQEVRVRTFDPGWGGHRGFIIDIADIDDRDGGPTRGSVLNPEIVPDVQNPEPAREG